MLVIMFRQLNYSAGRSWDLASMTHPQQQIAQLPQQLTQTQTQTQTLTQTQPTQTQPLRDGYTSMKLAWGPAVWTFLHTLANKIRDDQFHGAKQELLDIIYAIVTNLPCHICSAHAKSYFQANNINHTNIHDKKTLVQLLFDFHNHVNQNKLYPLFPYTLLAHTYAHKNTAHVANNFLLEFTRKHNNAHMLLANNMHRQHLTNTIKTYLQNNLHRFNT